MSNGNLVLLDVRLPDGNGLDLLADLSRSESGQPPAVIVTAYAEVRAAVEAMKRGVADYLTKPVDLDELELVIERLLGAVDLRRRLEWSRTRETHAIEGDELLGESPAMCRVREEIAAAAALARDGPAPAPTVLLLGETGTGKDLAARLLHVHGARSQRSFVHVDCAALPKDLVASELFGSARGAFTGADRHRAGLIEAAEDGTLFLDEIGELPLDLQGKLLAVLERRRVRRIGSTREIPVAARILAATNRPLTRMVAERSFREDLFYRLNVLTITMPPLRDCPGDAGLLARSLAADIARRYGRSTPELTGEALARIDAYEWPGNVRELRNVVERAVLLVRGGRITAADLALERRPPRGGRDSEEALTLEEGERRLIETALGRAGGNVSEAARQLGVTRMTLRYRIRKLGIRDSDG